MQISSPPTKIGIYRTQTSIYRYPGHPANDQPCRSEHQPHQIRYPEHQPQTNQDPGHKSATKQISRTPTSNQRGIQNTNQLSIGIQDQYRPNRYPRQQPTTNEISRTPTIIKPDIQNTNHFVCKFSAPLATKVTYKMRSGEKRMWGRGPALYKHNYYPNKKWGHLITINQISRTPFANQTGSRIPTSNQPESRTPIIDQLDVQNTSHQQADKSATSQISRKPAIPSDIHDTNHQPIMLLSRTASNIGISRGTNQQSKDFQDPPSTTGILDTNYRPYRYPGHQPTTTRYPGHQPSSNKISRTPQPSSSQIVRTQ